MASVFGFAEIKSRIDGWRAGLSGVSIRRSFARKPSLALVDADADQDAVKESHYDLSLLLENVVIPRLVAERGPARPPVRCATPVTAPPEPVSTISDAEVEKFAALAVAGDAPALLDVVDDCLAAGLSVETLYVRLLAPAARKLGENWEDDSRDFVDVTMGLWRIQEILRELALRVPPPARADHGRRTALFSAMPGEQHSFGTLMIADCFERTGWDCDVLIEPATSDITGKIAHKRYDLVGLTVSCDCSSAALSGLVSALRAVSSNPGIRIMLGGRFINACPELVAQCGADATAADAPAAVALADRLVPAQAGVFTTLF
jgi:MerR family transcriptional regulator, light-induced transcriptional regulator